MAAHNAIQLGDAGVDTTVRTAATVPPFPGMIWIPGGTYQMGSDRHYPEEGPAHPVSVDGFWIDKYPVTNQRFVEFVAATRYTTYAEIAPDPNDYPGALQEMLHPGSLVFTKPKYDCDIRDHTNWWSFVLGANWMHPRGAGTNLKGLRHHPVVHVAYRDAEAFAQWEGKHLPTEAEWERAARGGLDAATYAWGEEFTPGGAFLANTWQGVFPQENLCLDGFESTLPVDAFPPNGYGVFDMIGNVWEWTCDWYEPRHAGEGGKTCCSPHNPRGGAESASFDPSQPTMRIPRKVLKGGSHLCAPNYCVRFRPAARFPEPIDTSTCHVGFRCVVRA